MKHISYFLVIMACVLLSSCDEFDFDAARTSFLKTEYNEAFVAEFGTYGVLNIDETHNWGFEECKQDTTAISRSVNPNSNEWYIVPEDISDEERERVTNWFKHHIDKAYKTENTPNDVYVLPSTSSVNWTDFFVQHVYGEHGNMDHLVVSEDGKKAYDHVYNFNSNGGTIQLLQNATSKAFGYMNSLDSKEHYEYTVQYIYGAFYVGLDFYANGQNPNQQEARDGFYSDWIVKITPCLPKEDYGKRIMAEDLGVIGDFDFNDVVFDCYIKYNQYWHGGDFGIVILRAAGGTLPLYVDGNEVHEMFGVATDHITNTSNKTEVAPVIFKLKEVKSANPRDIEIIVNNNGKEYKITSDNGDAPGKLCLPTTVDWTNERQNIKDKYPKFTKWIENKNMKFWK